MPRPAREGRNSRAGNIAVELRSVRTVVHGSVKRADATDVRPWRGGSTDALERSDVSTGASHRRTWSVHGLLWRAPRSKTMTIATVRRVDEEYMNLFSIALPESLA
jgi:hypothetical protein